MHMNYQFHDPILANEDGDAPKTNGLGLYIGAKDETANTIKVGLNKTTTDDIKTANQSTNTNNNSTKSSSIQKLSLEGTINKEYPVSMELVQNSDGGLSGFYYYDRKGPEHRLNVYGKLDGSRFRLQEYDNNDNNTGNFVGTYHNGMVTGTFSLPDGKTMSFDLEVVN